MNAVSPICLIDLAPALRWSTSADRATVNDALRHQRLADGWWQSLPLTRVLDIAGAAWLAQRVADIAVERWSHLSLVEFMPTLRGLSVDMDDIAEPVRGTVLATAGDWEKLVTATPETMHTWGCPQSCGVSEIIGTVMWQAVQPFSRESGSAAPAPSPALMVEAVRTIAHWMPDSAPEHVHSALAYLSTATGADRVEEAAAQPSTGASRAIRTLRALRSQRAEDDPASLPAEPPPPRRDAPTTRTGRPFGSSGTLRRPAFGPPKASRNAAETPAEPPAEPPAEATAEPTTAEQPPAPAEAAPTMRTEADYPLVDLLDQLFRGWGDLERTVAAERLFAAEPVSIRLLAEQTRADIPQIRHAQRGVEEHLLHWLGSSAGSPITSHIRSVSESIGVATTMDHLIAAHPEHPIEIPALGTPLWRVVITLFTDRRLHDGWLVAIDPHQLRARTCELLAGRPSVTEAGNRLARLGIRTQAVRAWLLSIPGVIIRDGYVLLDDAAVGESGASAPPPSAAEPAQGTTNNGLPIRRKPAPAPTRQPEPSHEVGSSARCFRAPDGRWWHRVDVTADQLNGAPVTVPPGYAAHLGLQTGRLLCLTGPGADLLVLVWRDQPAFDSLRPLLRRLSAQPGDRVFITVQGDQLDARKLAAAETGTDNGPACKALHLIGYTAPASAEEALEIIARRISSSGTSGADGISPDPKHLVELLNKRGDTDIVSELRPSLYATTR